MVVCLGSQSVRNCDEPWRARFVSWRHHALAVSALMSLGFILLPMVFVVWLAFFAQEIAVFPPRGYSLRWFRAVFEHRQFVSGFITSLQVGVASTVLGLCLGIPAALALARRQDRLAKGLNQLQIGRAHV